MNEDPTIPIGELTPPTLGGREDVPAAAAAAAESAPGAAWGSFTLLARVGHGGFGEVYRAWDPHLQREVALKLLLPGAVGGEAEYEAMLREARALASVHHPNIVPVHGIDRHDGRVGFWTDFVRGKTLSVLVREQGTFGAREAALIGLDVTRALSAVHRAGLLHRDIKAENVMREEGGRILLMDFGLSALEQRQTNIAGTPNYMAPELFDGGKSTVATDIYAVGVLLYFLVAGDYPIHLGGLTTREAIDAFPRRKPLMDLRPDLPESLLRTVSTAMDMDPAKRFQSAGQLANAMAESLGTHAPVEVSVASEQRLGRKPAAKWMFAGLLTLTVIVGASLAWYGTRGKPSRDANAADSSATGAMTDEFQKGQKLLMRSYKEADLAEAVKAFQSVLAKDKNNALAEARLGAAYLAQYGYAHDPKLLDMATDASQGAIKLNPDLAAPYITLASIAALQGQTQLATQYLQTAKDKEPNSPDVHGARGELYEAQGKPKEALDEYKQAAILDPDDWRWPMSLGVAEFRQGNIEEAIRQLRIAAQKAPENAVAFYDLSIVHRQMGQMEEARKEMQRALDLDPTARKYAAMGSLLLLEGNYEQAAEMEKKAIALNSNSREAYEDLGAAYAWSGTHREDKIRAYRNAIALEEAERAQRPHDATLLANLADDYAEIGDAEKSTTLAMQALALAPDDPEVNYKAGDAFETLGQRSQAITLIAKALASGYNTYEFEHNPRLSSLRGDPNFVRMLNELKQKKK
jgi:eukaryotic-like serine/threonine-protein kinase